MHEIKIYGYIANVAEQTEKEFSLLDLQRQLSEAKGEDILVRINSHGGDAEEGFAMYNELRRYASENKANVKTFAESRLGSIATIIFLAGDDRELSNGLQPFVHNASFTVDRELTDKEQNELDVLNNRLANHYADHTDLTFDEALELMKAETFIETETAKSMRFCTLIEQVLKPVALRKFNNLNFNTNMNNKGIIARAIKMLTGLKAVNKLVFTAENTEVDFYELEEDDAIEVGANATVNNEPATGEHVMADGRTFIFEAGVLTEIKEVEDEVESDEMVALKSENAELASQLEAMTNKVEELVATNTAQALVISNSKKVASASAPTTKKQNPKEAPVAKVSESSKAVGNFNKFKTK